MDVTLLIIMLSIIECESIVNTSCPNVKNLYNFKRKRRHLVFPEKTNAIITASVLKVVMTHAPSGWNIGAELDVMYPLPDFNFTLAHGRRKLHHRQKRELWTRLEKAMDYNNLNGQACVHKSVCEAKLYLAPPGKSLLHDILRAIFTAPVLEEDFVKEIKGHYDELLDPDVCNQIFNCPISLLYFIASPSKN